MFTRRFVLALLLLTAPSFPAFAGNIFSGDKLQMKYGTLYVSRTEDDKKDKVTIPVIKIDGKKALFINSLLDNPNPTLYPVSPIPADIQDVRCILITENSRNKY